MKLPLFETRITGIKHHKYGYSTYEIVTTYWNDGTKTEEEVPGKIVFIDPIVY